MRLSNPALLRTKTNLGRRLLMAGNATELRATVAAIEADPRSWDQAYVVRRQECGTTMCFAGQTLARKGYEPAYDADGGVNEFYWIRPSDGKRVNALSEATDILELPDDVDGDNPIVDTLFYRTAGDTPEKMRELVEAIIADDGDVIAKYDG